MRIFLLWKPLSDDCSSLDRQRVSSNLTRLFSPLFSLSPQARIMGNSVASMISLELPVSGWKPAFFQEDKQTWAFAPEYPINAKSVLEARGVRVTDEVLLPTLGRELQAHPIPLLQELAPPFVLFGTSKLKDEMFVQNDGLGQSQLFEFNDGRLWAMSNKINAFKALDVELRPDPEQWAVWSTLRSFPLTMTGYQNIRFLEPATQLKLNSTGIKRTKFDILSDWVNPKSPMSSEDCLELAKSSLLRQIQAGMPLWEKLSVGLSGGWDSRAIVSTLRVAGAKFDARVRGLPERPDVRIAHKLATIADFPIRIKSSSGLPPDNVSSCRQCILQALRWQAGYLRPHKHKTFLARGKLLDGGVVNMMGQYGEIGRAFWARKIKAAEVNEDLYEEFLISHLMARCPPYTEKTYREYVRDVMLQCYRQADKYNLQGLARLDFFSLYHGTRRAVSGSLSGTGVVLAPFLNPDYIRAAFSYRGKDKESNIFPEYIISHNSPEWANVPYSVELEKKEICEPAKESVAYNSSEWRRPTGSRTYDSPGYWKAVGFPIIKEALIRGGFWTEIFDVDVASKQWQEASDQLAILHLLSEVADG